MRCTQRETAACGFALAQPGLRERDPASGHTPTSMTTPQFPTSRPRRLRHNPLVRAMVRETHQEYVKAGAEILETNTFGASRPRLAAFGLAEKLRDIMLPRMAIDCSARRPSRPTTERPMAMSSSMSVKPPARRRLTIGSPCAACR